MFLRILLCLRVFLPGLVGWVGWVGLVGSVGLAGLVGLVGLAEPAMAAPASIPVLTGRVVDTVGVLSPSERAGIESGLAQIESQRGAQMAVLVVATTGDEPIEAFSLRVAEAWRLGRGEAASRRDTGSRSARALDDGLLLVIAAEDRRVRLEVGYGLEAVIPDAVAHRIITQILVPRLGQGDWAGALAAVVTEVGRRLEAESSSGSRLEDDGSVGKGRAEQGDQPLDEGVGSGLGVLAAIVLGWAIARRLGRPLGSAVGATFATVVGALTLSWWAGLLLGLMVAGLVWLLGGPKGGGPGAGPGSGTGSGPRSGSGPGPRASGPRIVWGSGAGAAGRGGRGSGLGGVGGFGGRGGGFGGGGASGRW